MKQGLDKGCGCAVQPTRRWFLGAASGAAFLTVPMAEAFAAAQKALTGKNLGAVAKVSTSFLANDSNLDALSDGAIPKNSHDGSTGRASFWPQTGTQWVQFEWETPVTADRMHVYWMLDYWEVKLPKSYRLLFWDGAKFAPVEALDAYQVKADAFQETRFKPVTTSRLRLEVEGDGKFSTGLLDWQVMSAGPVPALRPFVVAGVDRSVVTGCKTYLDGLSRHVSDKGALTSWKKLSGPGSVIFANAALAETTAKFGAPGTYELELQTVADNLPAKSKLTVKVVAPPPAKRLDVVYTKKYAINNPLWSARAKALIVNWIPHVTAYCERTDLPLGEGGIDNFIEAGKANRGEPHAAHRGYVFSNAWVLQQVEAMCVALMVDPQGDAEIEAAQAAMHKTLDRWIPIILAAQEPDGYLQTAKTLAAPGKWDERWDPAHRGDHEGYIAGYFIESAINHYTLTEGRDVRLYNAAKRLADCWANNLGPGKKAWYDGHQEMEQALVRFGRFVNDMEGGGHGDRYIQLARFLLESRRGGSHYDQSHLPPKKQYEAVGHAVRAVYFYSGMADIAAEYGDPDYQSAVASLWDNMVNRKYYVTGGVGSVHTSEGFGKDYSLPHDAYCESCSSCGFIFFQYKMNLAYHDAKFADLYEQTMYNALLGGIDIEGKGFSYTNPLENTDRTLWNFCPCCVANITRTLLMVPTWSYVKGDDGLYVNLFIGGSVTIENVAGTDVRMEQTTDYPRSGAIAMTVHPKKPKRFTLSIRIPDRSVSALYTASPKVSGYRSLKVNGETIRPKVVKGYARITREWRDGDRVELELPMQVQRITCDERVAENAGQIALAYGPLVYNVELADQPALTKALGSGPIVAEWSKELLGGVTVLRGTWADGSPMTAIPHYARMNRTGRTTPFAPFIPEGVKATRYDPNDKAIYSRTWVKA